MSVSMWILWAFALIFQNYSFTFVSRARNSGSLARHMKAAILSNGAWFVTQIFTFSAFMHILKGDFGWKLSLFALLYYTAFTMLGSLVAHFVALHTEKGSGAVGANKKYAQIAVEDWENVKAALGWNTQIAA